MMPTSPAIACSATARRMRRIALWPWLFTAVLIGCPVACAQVTVLSHRYPKVAPVVAALFGALLLSAIIGIVGPILLYIRFRMMRVLRKYPWVEYRVRSIQGGDCFELFDAAGNPVSQLTVTSWFDRLSASVDRDTPSIWFAGDPTHVGVVSLPGGATPRYAVDRGPVEKPAAGVAGPAARHGDRTVGGYPTPRRVAAFALDVVLHAAPAAAVYWLERPHYPQILLVVVAPWLAVSFLDRVVVQSIAHTTIGKALFGLMIVRPEDGEPPSFGRLAKVWLFNVVLPLLLDSPEPKNVGAYFLPAVRR